MACRYEKSKSTKKYNLNLDLATLDISARNISHSTMNLPKRVIDNIRWFFSGEIRERIKQK